MNKICAYIIMVTIIPFNPMPLALAKQLSVYYQTIEDELIKKTDDFDKLLDDKGFIYPDKELQIYVNSIGIKLVPVDYLDLKVKIRFKIITDPTLNAMALPNGTIWVHSGLLARLHNEAQLAFILGHEISHIIHKDTLYLYERATTDVMFAKILDIGLSAASALFGLYADLGQLGLVFLTKAAISGYGREKEKRADLESIDIMVKAGYSPKEAISTFVQFIEEKEKYEEGIEIYFLSSHPSNRYRKEAVEELITGLPPDLLSKNINSSIYEQSTYLLKKEDANRNIKIERLQHAVDAVEYLIQNNKDDAENFYILAECYRLIAEDRTRLKYELNRKNWLKVANTKQEKFQADYFTKAKENYLHALELNTNFSDSYKGLGLLYAAQQNNDEAITNLQKYLELKPNTKDRRYIHAAISKLKETKQGTQDETKKH